MNKKDWKVKKLGEISKINYGYTEKASFEEIGPKFLRITDIQDNNVDWNTVPFCKIEKDELSKYQLSEGDIVFARTGATTGKSFLVKNPPLSVFASYLIRLQVIEVENLLPDFLLLYFQTEMYWNTIRIGLSGSAQGGFNASKLADMSIPIPPIHEQQRIVVILDEAFRAIAKAKENAEKNLQNAQEVFESYLQSVFANSGDQWEEKNLGDNNLLEIIDGDRGKNYPTKSEFFEEGFCLFMNTKNVRPNGLNFETVMFISEDKDKSLGKGKLKRNDVVMTTRGTIGNLGIYSNDVQYDNIRINSGMLIFRPNLKLIIPEYLFEVLRSGIIKAQIKKHVSGAAQPQLPIKTLVNFTLPVPKSITEQRSIVHKLNAFSIETKKLEDIYNQKLNDLEELKKSLLQKAFNGEL